MLKKSILAVSFLIANTAFAAPTAWNLDTVHTSIGFSVRHLGVSKTKGKFTAYEADILADDQTGKITSVKATVQSKSVNTDMPKRDEHLRAPDFFDATQFKTIKLVTKNIQWTGNKVIIETDLTIKNVTKTVKFEGEYLGVQKINFGDGDKIHAGYSVKADINRQDFGLKFNKIAEGVSVVGDLVTIELDVEIEKSAK